MISSLGLQIVNTALVSSSFTRTLRTDETCRRGGILSRNFDCNSCLNSSATRSRFNTFLLRPFKSIPSDSKVLLLAESNFCSASA